MTPIICACESAIYFRTRKYKSSPFAKRNYFFHQVIIFIFFFLFFGHLIYCTTLSEPTTKEGSLERFVVSDVLLTCMSTLAKSSCPVKTASLIITGAVSTCDK